MNDRRQFFFIGVILFLLMLPMPTATAADDITHRILVKIGTDNITQADFDEIGEVVFTLYFPERKLEEITPGELEQLNPLALKELITIVLIEDESKSLKGKDAVKVSSTNIAGYLRDYRIDSLYSNRLARRYAFAQLALNQIIRQYVAEPTPAPRKVSDFYKQHQATVFTLPSEVKVRHIFLSDDANNPDPSIERQAKRIFDSLAELPRSERLAEVSRAARSFSQDRFKANDGLLMLSKSEYFLQNQTFTMPDGTALFPQAMLDGIGAMHSPNDLELRRSDRGWHILFLEDIRGGEIIPEKQAKNFIVDFLINQAMDTAREKWLREKIKRTRITWNDGTEFPVEKVMFTNNEAARLNVLHGQMIRMVARMKAKKNG